MWEFDIFLSGGYFDFRFTIPNQSFCLLRYVIYHISDTPHSLHCHLKAKVLMVVKHHKIEHVALSAVGQTGADTGTGPDAGLEERV